MTNELTHIINQENLRVHDLFSFDEDEPEDADTCTFCGTVLSPLSPERCINCGRLIK